MPDLRSSSPAKRALAAELRRLREISGMSGDEVARRLRWSASKISRIETNRTGVRTSDLERLLDLYDAEPVRRKHLVALAREPEPRGWWNAYSDAVDTEYMAYIALEENAAHLRCWSPELIHGLLQTRDYANEVMAAGFGESPPISQRAIQDRIDVRMRRQSLLTSQEHKGFTFILDEATLLRRRGSPQIMHDQLMHLMDISARPNVTICVLAFTGVHPVVNPGGFAILMFDPVHETQITDAVYVERLLSSDFVENDTEAHEYRRAFDQLAEAALGPEESLALIERTAAERWS